MSNKPRKIKCVGNSVDTNEFFLHPITLELVLNKGPKKICPTELHYVNNKPYTVKPVIPMDDSKLSDRDIQNYMTVPYLNLNMEQMLSIYKIESIDSMVKWIDDNIDEKPLETINRILMVWIRLNFEELKENNRILVSIYKKIGRKYYNNKNEDLYQEKINNWFKNTDPNSFHLNLTEILSHN
jgi:hypothetical protein